MDQQQYNQPPQTPGVNTPPIPPQTPPQMPAGIEHTSSVGPIVGSIIVVLVIVLGGLYLYGSRMSAPETNVSEENGAENIVSAPDQSSDSLSQQGGTDDISEIEADLNATNLDDLDAETANVEGELKAQ